MSFHFSRQTQYERITSKDVLINKYWLKTMSDDAGTELIEFYIFKLQQYSLGFETIFCPTGGELDSKLVCPLHRLKMGKSQILAFVDKFCGLNCQTQNCSSFSATKFVSSLLGQPF